MEEIEKMKAFIFDLDGVIVFTDKFHYQAWKKMADRMGIYFDETINNRLRGVSRAESLEIILEKYEGEPLSAEKKAELMEEKNNTYRELLKHNSINCSSVILRRDVAREFPMEHDDSHEDYITWLKILRKYGCAAGINKPYLKYRLSEGGKSRNKLKSAAMTYNVYRYAGYGRIRSCIFFCSYAVHGIWKYCYCSLRSQ